MSNFSNNLRLMTHEMVVDAFQCLTPVAMSVTSQSKRVTNFLLVRRNGPNHADFEIVNIAFLSSQLFEAEFFSLPPLSQKSVNNADLRAHCKESKHLADLRRLVTVVELSTRSSDLDAALAFPLLDIELVRLLERGDPS